jgi:hypothetical protein
MMDIGCDIINQFHNKHTIHEISLGVNNGFSITVEPNIAILVKLKKISRF